MQNQAAAEEIPPHQRLLPTARATGSLQSWLLFLSSFLLSLALAFTANFRSLQAVFGPIDDHEPLAWLGVDGALPLTDYWVTLTTQTEVGQWGAFGRFRPAYYAIRIAEAVAFGDNPTRWYLFVTFIYALTCAVLAYSFSVWLSRALPTTSRFRTLVIALVAITVSVLVFAGMPSWVGIVTRLGPSELFGLLAVSALLLAVTKLGFDGPQVWWLLALVSIFIAVFSKEPFAAFALPLPLVGLFRFFAHGRSRVDLIAGVLGLLPAVVLAVIMLPTILTTGSDVYGQGVGNSRLQSAVSVLTHWYLPYWGPAAIALLLAWLAWSYLCKSCSRAARLYSLSLVLWLIGILFLDAWFYGGDYWAPRYFAVFGLSKTLQVLAAVCLAAAALRLANCTRDRILAGGILVISTLLLLGLVRTSTQALGDVAATARINRDATIAYQAGITDVLDQLSNNPDSHVIVSVSNGADYEPLRAVLQDVYLRSGGRALAYAITPFAAATGGDSPETLLAQLSKNGSTDWHLLPLGEAPSDGHRICVIFNDATAPADACERATIIRIPIRGM